MKYTNIEKVIQKFRYAYPEDYSVNYNAHLMQLYYEYKKFEVNFFNNYIFPLVKEEKFYSKEEFVLMLEKYIDELLHFYGILRFIYNHIKEVEEEYHCDSHYFKIKRLVLYSFFRLELAFYPLGYEITDRTKEYIISLEGLSFTCELGEPDKKTDDWDYDYCAKIFLNRIVEFFINPDLSVKVELDYL